MTNADKEQGRECKNWAGQCNSPETCETCPPPDTLGQGKTGSVALLQDALRAFQSIQGNKRRDLLLAGKQDEFGWLIEAPGARYLAVQRLNQSDNFVWTTDHNQALRFRTEEQADALMMAVRQMDRDTKGFGKEHLFSFETTLGNAKAVEHGWMS